MRVHLLLTDLTSQGELPSCVFCYIWVSYFSGGGAGEEWKLLMSISVMIPILKATNIIIITILYTGKV